MGHVLRSLAVFLFSLGGWGLLLLGILDSSFLFMPLGNDLLVVALTAAHPVRMPWYVLMASAGSTIGVAITDWVSAKVGKEAIEGKKKSKQIAYVERKVSERGGIAIALAALMPPPFPFTPVIVVAAALQYPRKKMVAIVLGGRVVRFSIGGGLAVIYGRGIIQLANSPAVKDFIIALVIMSLAGSAFSIGSWVRKGRNRS